MKRTRRVVVFLLLTLFGAVLMFGCETPANLSTAKKSNLIDDLNPYQKIEELPSSHDYTTVKAHDLYVHIDCTVYARDTDFRPLSGADVYFGEKAEYLGKTNEAGYISFIIYSKGYVDLEHIASYIRFDASKYDFTAYCGNDYSSALKITVIAEPVEKNIDVTKVYSINGKITFAESGVALPAGYVSRDIITSEGDLSVNGETSLSGVKFYAVASDGSLNYISTSDNYEMGLEYIRIGTVIAMVKEKCEFYDFTERLPEDRFAVVAEYDPNLNVPQLYYASFLNLRGKFVGATPNEIKEILLRDQVEILGPAIN
jgi:hypothetical protein